MTANVDTFKSDGLVTEETAFSHGFVDETEEEIDEEITETEDMSDLENTKEDKDTSGDNLEGGFVENFGGEASKIPSISEALKSDDPIYPEGYMDLMFKKKNQK